MKKQIKNDTKEMEIEVSQILFLSNLLEIQPDTLLDLAAEADALYVRFPISKGKGRKRWIEAPKQTLKYVQKDRES